MSDSTDIAPPAPASGRRLPGAGASAVVRIGGAIVAIGLLATVVFIARGQMTPEKWAALRSASLAEIGTLVGLGAFSVILNGVLWWLAIRPVRPLSVVEVTSVNALATFIGYVPFKLSVLFRAAYHRLYDGVPVLQFGGWLFAVTAVLAAAVAPGILAALFPVRERFTLWLGIAVVGAIACGLVGALISRSLASGAGWRSLRRASFMLANRRGLRFMRSGPVTNMHTGVCMLADARITLIGVGLRLLDAAGLAVRFWIAARVLGVALKVDEATIGGVSYFVLGATAPTGAVGVREAGSAGVFGLLGLDPKELVTVLVLVTATQFIGELIAASAGAAILGPKRLKRARELARNEAMPVSDPR